MLPAERRLRESDAFRRTVRSGRRAGSPALVVHLLTRDVASRAHGGESTPSAVGFVVSKAVGGAVVRNRVKRRLRHVVAARLAGATALPGGSEVVVRALPPSAELTSAELDAELGRCLDRVLRGPDRATRTGAPR